ncbi:helix-turn-helix domain-containing protein [Salinicoccus roseus]|uniref:helix-turn-helix domain-containing protein n=1 Tax=Salinicoccus roseus TaxID=45670 RepID=UPI0022FFD2B6|nr:helix-turn-helix transcriptional regulator [Salinicoccus roseus]
MLSANLKRLRNRRQWTQQQVSEKLGVTRPAYTAYEKGTRTPDANMLGKIADLFEVTVDELLGRQSREKDIFDEADVLMFSDKEGFDNLSEEEKQELKDMLNDQLEYWINKKNKDKK